MGRKVVPHYLERRETNFTFILYRGFPSSDILVFLCMLELKSMAASALLMSIPNQLYINIYNVKDVVKAFLFSPVNMGLRAVFQNQRVQGFQVRGVDKFYKKIEIEKIFT